MWVWRGLLVRKEETVIVSRQEAGSIGRDGDRAVAGRNTPTVLLVAMDASERPATIYGVDFSAARRDAGRNTWIAKCEVAERSGEGALVVERLADAAEFLGCDPGRESMLPALVELIGGNSAAPRAFGLDFPFGLPRELQGRTWHEFVSGVRECDEWGELGEVDGPRALYDGARARAENEGVGLRRETDEECGGQEPTGFRIKTQTFYGVSALLAEVADEVAVLPMDDEAGKTVVIETYPAATFRRLADELDVDVHDTGYKRDTREAIDRRRRNVDALAEAGVEFDGHDEEGHEEFAVASDHALDAVAAAWATWQAAESGYRFDAEEAAYDEVALDVAGPAARSEGYIYR